jgi:outer membrane protein TolC
MLALVGGCQNLPWRQQAAPKPELVVPAAWRTPSVAERNMAERDWRSVFAGPELSALIDEALAGNSDLRVAVLRIDEAQARYGVQRSQLFPSLGLNAAYQRQRQPGFGPDNVDSEAASLGLALPSWEIDLWGRLRDLNEGARQNLLATTDTAAAVRTMGSRRAVRGRYRRAGTTAARREVPRPRCRPGRGTPAASPLVSRRRRPRGPLRATVPRRARRAGCP